MTKERTKRRRIFYVPGMISLVLIPLFCLYHFYKVDAFKVYGSINISMPYEKDYFAKYKFASLREYKVFDFNENESKTKEQLKNVRLYLQNLIKARDTINGVKLHYGPKMHYETFIKTIDILNEVEAPVWGIDGNDVYIFAARNTPKKVKKDTTYVRMNCGTGELMRQEAYFKAKQKKEDEAFQFQAAFVKEKWKFISLGFVGLVLLNVFVLVKFNRQRYL
ncbi:hypothetical protein [Flavobacterium hungaricum]|uniref:Uncharacterized protein n=1 Tax=Flavobacterium hungaricum TaxID=2082725 RepID=A0ABR9TRM2_9FLAO|nr:hypothetical protein [Flavobacterium hungaricum]MBE8728021.1 hypothetical protein [Flavobacterium hungaricum]